MSGLIGMPEALFRAGINGTPLTWVEAIVVLWCVIAAYSRHTWRALTVVKKKMVEAEYEAQSILDQARERAEASDQVAERILAEARKEATEILETARNQVIELQSEARCFVGQAREEAAEIVQAARNQAAEVEAGQGGSRTRRTA